VDQDGVVQVELRPAGRERWIWIVGLAGIGALVALGLGLRSRLGPTPAAGGRHAGSGEQAPPAAQRGGSRAPGGAGRTGAARPMEGAPAAPGGPGAAPSPGSLETPEPPEALDPEAAGEFDGPENAGEERAGMSLFPARGTKPIKRGIVVPDDFELPPGYVRHFQTTDKGRMLPGILMFHPDYQPLDADGRPIPVPPDRVVPREMAPPGLPIEMLEVSKEDLEVEETSPPPDHDGADTDP
jgi:hypothetical protein